LHKAQEKDERQDGDEGLFGGQERPETKTGSPDSRKSHAGYLLSLFLEALAM
jgi:hypothetical protein